MKVKSEIKAGFDEWGLPHWADADSIPPPTGEPKAPPGGVYDYENGVCYPAD